MKLPIGPRPLGLHEVPEATVLPWRPGETRGTIEMGVLDARGRVLRETLVCRTYARGGMGRVGHPGRPDPAPEATCPGTAIYAGPWLPHFGHYLLEGLARAWAVMRHPELPVVWSAPADPGPGPGTATGAGGSSFGGWRAALVGLLGIENEMILATRPMRFERLLVPQAGYRIQHFCHPEHAAALGVLERRPEPGRKLWLSRSKLPQLQNLSIPAVEARLEELGWTVIAPETLPVAEQMDELARAERVAGEIGSQLHSLLFLKEPKGLRVDIFLRDPTRGPFNLNYATIAAAKGLDQRLHRMASEVVLRTHAAQVEKHSTDIDEYFRALGPDLPSHPPAPPAAAGPATSATEPSTPASAGPPPSRSSRGHPMLQTAQPAFARINRLAEICKAQRYLEVGVATGRTFTNVAIPTRHAVDPVFRFDTAPLETADVRFFPMTSDRFFTEVVPRDMFYDIIFLDGLHTFEQTFRDFCASMSHAHADTVWIIDDVIPNDVFSAIPSQQEAVAFRKQHGLKGRLWHGDVYKTIFAINDFFPTISFRTLRRGYGNPQTVLINRPRESFRPIFNNLETISRMTYFDFCKHRPKLNLATDPAIFEWVAASRG